MCVGTPPESNAPRTHSTQRIEPSRALMTTFSLGSTMIARATALASFSTVVHVIVFSGHSLRLHGAISLVHDEATRGHFEKQIETGVTTEKGGKQT